MKQGLCALRCGFAILIVVAAIIAESHEAHHNAVSPEKIEAAKLEKINSEYLKSVKPLFQKACFDCHSSSTNMPWYGSIPGVKQLIESDIDEAKKHLDMTGDFPFAGHASPHEDLKAISKSIKEATMPPRRYRIMHSSSALTDDEKKIIQDWISKSVTELDQ